MYVLNFKKFVLYGALITSLLIPQGYAIEEVSVADANIVKEITFEHVIQKAIDHSYDLKIADYNKLIAKEGIKGARSEYFPKLNLTAGTEYTKNFRDIFETTVMSVGENFINPYTRYQAVLGINLTYNLFDFGVRKGNLDIAKEDVNIKELESEQKTQDLNLTLVDTYSKILIAKHQIDINKEILKLEENNLELKNRLFNAKEISSTELNDEKVKVERVKTKINELTSMMDEAFNWLAFYTGEQYDIEQTKVAEIKKADFDLTAYKDYTKSVTWQIYEKQIKKKELELKVVKRTNYPKLYAYSRYYLYGSDRSSYKDSFGNVEPSNYTIGASLNVPIFDGLKNNADIHKTALELKQLQVERDKAIAELMTKLAVMRSNLIYIDEQIENNNNSIKELNEKQKSVKKLLSKKVVSPIEANDSKIELLEQTIELEKNSITSIALTRGIEILTRDSKNTSKK